MANHYLANKGEYAKSGGDATTYDDAKSGADDAKSGADDR